MKICTFDEGRVGAVREDETSLVDVTDLLFPDGAVLPWPTPVGDPVITRLDAARDAIARAMATGTSIPLSDVALGPSVATPGKIIGAPINYQLHIDEANADHEINHSKVYTRLDDFGLFLKANSSLAGPSQPIDISFTEGRVDHEIELCIVIGRSGRMIRREDAMDHIAGYTVGLDMTVRGKEWPGFRKSPDGFAVLGPWFVSKDEIANPDALDFELKVNGETRQKANTRDLIFDCAGLIEYASRMYSLHPGDVIMTGTPAGVAPIKSGDRLEAWMEGLGTLHATIG